MSGVDPYSGYFEPSAAAGWLKLAPSGDLAWDDEIRHRACLVDARCICNANLKKWAVFWPKLTSLASRDLFVFHKSGFLGIKCGSSS